MKFILLKWMIFNFYKSKFCKVKGTSVTLWANCICNDAGINNNNKIIKYFIFFFQDVLLEAIETSLA